ncbi:MAG: RluA family pseudouridine synthase [Candidatus Omnitrophota bacterium]
MPKQKKVPKRHQPKGFDILYEDADIIVGNKAAGSLTVSALWNKEDTIHSALNRYVRRGNARSRKCVYAVHRLDQATSGALVFAKTERAQRFLKDHWKETAKIYYAVVHGHFSQKSGTLSSYLVEDDDYVVHSVPDGTQGKLARTAYTVVKETGKFSLLKIDLLTGRKNQIRVHCADAGHPVAGDTKYGRSDTPRERLALHAQSISLTHPFSGRRLTFEAGLPEYFNKLVGRL